MANIILGDREKTQIRQLADRCVKSHSMDRRPPILPLNILRAIGVQPQFGNFSGKYANALSVSSCWRGKNNHQIFINVELDARDQTLGLAFELGKVIFHDENIDGFSSEIRNTEDYASFEREHFDIFLQDFRKTDERIGRLIYFAFHLLVPKEILLTFRDYQFVDTEALKKVFIVRGGVLAYRLREDGINFRRAA
jgi:IrrE N-terminal-like domain